MKKLLSLILLFSSAVCFGQGQPSSDSTPQTLSNKTISGANNTLSAIPSSALSNGVTGTGAVVQATAPTIANPVISGASLSAVTLYADAFASAGDMSQQIAACLNALYAASPTSGRCIANYVGNQTWSVNPYTYATNIPVTGTLEICGTGQITLNVPIVRPDNWNMEGCGMAQGSGGALSNRFVAGASFPAAYTTGTITKGTAGYLDVITFSGSTLTANMVGCSFVAPATQPTVSNRTYGIIHSVNVGASTATLGWGADAGTGASAASSFAIYCGMMVAGDGAKYGSPYFFTGDTSHFDLDCNNVVGCDGYVNWFSEEGTTANDLVIINNVDIGFDLETTYAQQAGPYTNISIQAGGSGSCNTAAIGFVSRAGTTATRGLFNSDIGGAFGCHITLAADIQSNYQVIAGMHLENAVTGIGLGLATNCPTACPAPLLGASAANLTNINVAGSGTTAVSISNVVYTNGGTVLRDISVTGGWTNAVYDLQNSCTAQYNVGLYVLGSQGNVQESTATSGATVGCLAKPYMVGMVLPNTAYYGGTGSTTLTTLNGSNNGYTIYFPATNGNVAVVANGSPTIASGACGTTTNGGISGYDDAGKITIGSAATATCVVSFASTHASAPLSVVLQAANAGAASAISGEYISAVGTGGFTITGTLASTTWYYWVQ